MSSLKIIVPENFKEFGEKVNLHLKELKKLEEGYTDYDEDFIIYPENIRFNNGEGKCFLPESVRDKDLYILSDVSNNSLSYSLRSKPHDISPDEHFMDIIRILSAECGHASKRTLIMPYLYGSRQDRREARESLDCAVALQWLTYMGVDEIVTCDVHNKGVMNAVPNTPFENMYLTDTMLVDWALKEEIFDFENVICISPDEGAMKRARFFSEVLDNALMASFYKYRSQKIENGHGQIKEHKFLGNPEDLKGRVAIITDDMIDTGGSILDTAKQLKQLGVDKVYLMTTFAFFSKGTDKFEEYYNNGYIEKVYATNLVHVSDEIKNKPWFETVDCSSNVAHIINEIHYGRSIGEVIKGRDDILRRIRKIKERKKMKKLNKKGFTLVELLAVVVILLAISVIAVSSISAAIERNKEKQNNAKIEVILSYAKLYYESHKNTEKDNCINLNDLELSDSEKEDTDGNPFRGVVKHTNGKNYKFDDTISSCP